MKQKSLVPLLVVFALLVGLVVLKQVNKRTPSIVEQVKLASLVPEGVAKADIAKLELYTGSMPDQKVILERDANDVNVWSVASHFNAPADTKKVEDYIDKIVGLKGEARETVADDAALEPYSLTDKDAFHVLGYKKGEDKPAFTVLVGKAPKFDQIFMRAADAKDVYVLNEDLKREAGVFETPQMPNQMQPQEEKPAEPVAPKADNWLNKNVLDIAKDKLAKVVMQSPDKRIVVTRETKEVPVEEPAKPEGADAAKPEDKPAEEAKPATKTETKWVLSEGGAGLKAKENGLSSLPGAFAPLTASDIVDPSKLAEWGLETPVFTCTLTVDGQEGETVIQGGRPDPNGDGYVRVSTDKRNTVYKIAKFSFDRIFGKGADLFEIGGMQVDENAVARYQVSGATGAFDLVKNADKWTVAAPSVGLEAQESTLKSAVSAAAKLRPADYADSADGKGFDAPSQVITVTTSAGEAHTITFGGEAKSLAGRYAKLDANPMVFVIAKTDVDRLLVAPKDLFVRSVLDGVSEDDIQRITVTRKEDNFAIVLGEGEKWSIEANGATKPADTDKCHGLLASLTGFQASDIVFDQTGLSGEPQATIRIAMKDGSERVLHFGAEENGAYPFAVEGKGILFKAESMDV
ncbi:MAG: DUF4340 domain-containing protein, partial [Candidatus Hydrogenedentes bacterium]|nr:DUF4340 domain-containing protein [Candidatus Hydrogenedentota bacterium]